MEEKIPFHVGAFILTLCYQVHDKIRAEIHNNCHFCATVSFLPCPTPRPPTQSKADFILSNWWTLVSKALNSKALLKRL